MFRGETIVSRRLRTITTPTIEKLPTIWTDSYTFVKSKVCLDFVYLYRALRIFLALDIRHPILMYNKIARRVFNGKFQFSIFTIFEKKKKKASSLFFHSLADVQRYVFEKDEPKPAKIEASRFEMRPSGSLHDFPFIKLYQF